MTRTEIMNAAHADTRRAVAEQRATKHVSAHRSYAAIFALCLRGAYINEAAKRFVPAAPAPKFLWLTGL